jgi:hypothetical protein
MDMMNAARGTAGLAGLTHPNGILYFVSLVFLMVWCERQRLSCHLWGPAAIPYCIGAAARRP